MVERTFGWLGRFRKLARDYERLADTLKNRHWLAFLGLLNGSPSLAAIVLLLAIDHSVPVPTTWYGEESDTMLQVQSPFK